MHELLAILSAIRLAEHRVYQCTSSSHGFQCLLGMIAGCLLVKLKLKAESLAIDEMSFFASRRNGKSSTATTTAVQTVKKPVVIAAAGASSTSKVGSNAQTSATSNPASTTATTTTKLVTVTRRVSKEDRPVSLKERQREGKLKREAEEEQLRRRAALAAQRQAEAEETAERRRKALAKGKGRAADLPARKFTVESSTSSEEDDDNEDDSGELGTPFKERRQPLKVLREDVAAPIDDLREVDVIPGTQLVENNRKAYTQCAYLYLLERSHD